VQITKLFIPYVHTQNNISDRTAIGDINGFTLRTHTHTHTHTYIYIYA